MYWLDSTILALLAIGALVGAWTGFLWQVARILSLALSLYAAILANDDAGLGDRLRAWREAQTGSVAEAPQ